MTDPTDRVIAQSAALLRHHSTIMRALALAGDWSQRPCVAGRRLDNDDEDMWTECLHCASADLRATLTGEAGT